MKDEMSNHRFESLSRLHKVLDMPAPMNPLVSLINNSTGTIPLEGLPSPHILNFYKISHKMNSQGRVKYGQHYYDFEEAEYAAHEALHLSEKEKTISFLFFRVSRKN
jgi:hypothetical protein